MIKYNRRFDRNSSVCYALVDHTHLIKDNYVKELIKNISDYTISNITDKGYDVYQGQNEDILLSKISSLDYTHCVVFTTGTEFLCGEAFFDSINELIQQDFLIAGHVLDRFEGYYELHKQCYCINLTHYNRLGKPIIGNTELMNPHTQIEPIRSIENIHDNYTPVYVKPGVTLKTYQHKLHGYNILSVSFSNDIPVIVFDKSIRSNKRYYYPEDNFLNESQWLYYRQSYAQQNFVHTTSNEFPPKNTNKKFNQIFTPASGTWWYDYLDLENECTVVLYDYNQRSLDYWREHAPKHNNIVYEYVFADLLGEQIDLRRYINHANSLFNLSNIFCYECTAPFTSLKYRLHQENFYIKNIKEHFPDSYLYFCNRALSGFTKTTYFDIATNFEVMSLDSIQAPTYHQSGDWCV